MNKSRVLSRQELMILKVFDRRICCRGSRLLTRLRQRQGFGLNEVIGIAAGIIIAVVVVIPGLQNFAGNILANLTNWWNDMASSVFATP